MNHIQQFDFRGHDVRIQDRDGEPWFIAGDVCRVLGYKNISRDIQRHCKGCTETVLP